MREVKFRAWERPDVPAPKGYAENPNFKGAMHYGIQDQTYFGNWLHDNGYIVMQFTGLKDKNGVEIYEGDIVRFDLYKGERVEVIEWENIAKHTSFGGGTHNATIIGNIYENPELLTK